MNPILIKPSGESSSQVVVRARTRDTLPWQIQKTCVTDGSFWRYKERSGTVIEPISNPYQTHDLCPVNSALIEFETRCEIPG